MRAPPRRRVRRRSSIVGSLLPLLLSTQARALAQTPSPAAEPTRTTVYEVNLPVELQGRFRGEVIARIDTANRVELPWRPLVELIEDEITSDAAARLEALSGADGYFVLDPAFDYGLSLAYDPGRLTLTVELPASARALREIQIVPEGRDFGGRVEPPRPISAGLSVALSQNFVHESAFDETGFDEPRAVFQGIGNVGGISGWNLAFETFYDGERPQAFARGDIVVFKDFRNQAVRLSLGDVNPVVNGFQSAPGLTGVAVQRLYGEIQPLRNIRPRGRTELAVDRPTLARVLVNQVETQVLRLAPGRYDLRNFQLAEGFNNVEILLEDETGRRIDTVRFNQFLDFDLLDQGVSEFEAAAGLVTRATLDGNEITDEVAVSGFYRKGFANNLLLGASAQGSSEGFASLGAEAVWGTPIGLFFVDGVASRSDQFGTGAAGAVGYSVTQQRAEGFSEFAVSAAARTRDYVRLDEAAPSNPNRFELTAVASTSLPARIQLSASAFQSFAREGPDSRLLSATLSRRFGPVTAFSSFEYAESAFRDEEFRFLISLNLRLGRRQNFRSQFDSRERAYTLEYVRRQDTRIGSTGVALRSVVGDDERQGSGRIDHFGNRFLGSLTHDYIGDFGGEGEAEQVSQANVAFGVGFAGGRVAVGRPIPEGFVIVDRHKSIRSKRVDVRTAFNVGAAARAGVFGPALVPTQTPYLVDLVTLEPEQLPVGFDVGRTRFQIEPGATSGYRITIGSDAVNTVIGTLLDRNGRPLTGRGGRLVSLDDPRAGPHSVLHQRHRPLRGGWDARGRLRHLSCGRAGSRGHIARGAG